MNVDRRQRRLLEHTDVWRKGDRLYRTIGFIDDPAVIIEDVISGKQETHVIHSRNFAEYQWLRAQDER